jgi:hypothetical protein
MAILGVRKVRKYMIILVVGLVFFAAGEFFRPWMYVNNVTSAKRPAGYFMIGGRPMVKSKQEMHEIFNVNDDYGDSYSVKLNSVRMLLQRALLLISVVWFLLFFSRDQKVVLFLLAILGIVAVCLTYFFIDTF